jgi:ATP-dependent exoDNAse (exonuclease V) alpha subunit
MIRNDPDKQWVNGTLAKVIALSADSIVVDINGRACDVPVVKWQKIEYNYNEDEDKIEDEVVGDFAQYPIKLAWAITIHKSQGQTFDKVIIDLGNGAFTHGQLYVALSRCTCLSGITLKRPVTQRDIIFDQRIYDIKDRFATLF